MGDTADRAHRAARGGGGLDPWREHDACGVGFGARASGEPSHQMLAPALRALTRVAHRSAAATDNSGDGAGRLPQIPRCLFVEEAAALGVDLKPGQPFPEAGWSQARERPGVGCNRVPEDAGPPPTERAFVFERNTRSHDA